MIFEEEKFENITKFVLMKAGLDESNHSVWIKATVQLLLLR